MNRMEKYAPLRRQLQRERKRFYEMTFKEKFDDPLRQIDDFFGCRLPKRGLKEEDEQRG